MLLRMGEFFSTILSLFLKNLVALQLDCTEGHYQKIEYGKINLSALQLMELADFFGVTTDYLLGRD